MKRKGFTLVELLAALPIGAVILMVVTASIFQIFQGRVDIAQKSIAMGDLDNAIHWLARDLTMAQDTSLMNGAPPTASVSIIWNDLTHWGADEGVVTHSVSYYLSETQLIRNYDGDIFIVGRYMTEATFYYEDRVFTITLTSRPGMSRSAITKTFSVEMRTDLSP
jgi:prepilin-type N-terminal cleavage/methylation domain-containing protein